MKPKIPAYVRTNMNIHKHDVNKSFVRYSEEVVVLLTMLLILLVLGA